MTNHEKLCDGIIERLKTFEKLMYKVRAREILAASELHNLCDREPYTGDVIKITVDDVVGNVLENLDGEAEGNVVGSSDANVPAAE